MRETGLPVAERCKTILAGNWRGQTTTVPAEPGKGNEEGGLGATDPPALVQLAQLSGRMPARVSLLGKLEQLPRSEVEHVLQHAHPAADAPAAGDVLAYAMQTMEIRYVDTLGGRHALGMGDVLGAVLDPL
ncbi:hypothetical protein WJX81_005980, partial [Elliptochloris bilobata]